MAVFALMSCIIHGGVNANETADVYERTHDRGHQSSVASFCPLPAGAQTHVHCDLQVLSDASEHFHRWLLIQTAGSIYSKCHDESFSNY